MKPTLFWGALIVISLFRKTLTMKKGYYTIIAPGTIRSDSVFHVSFTLNDFHKSCWYNISITSYHDGLDKPYEFNSIEVKPGTTKLVELHAPSLKSSLANLDIVGYHGIISKDSSLIYIESDQKWTLIQTNKFKYKPGDLVQFRVIYIDQLTRPAGVNEEINIDVYDSDFNIVRVFFNVKLVQGVFKGEFQLSDYPVLGDWRIEVRVGDKTPDSKFFNVDRYVLPKFNVQIGAKKVSIYDEKLELDIDATYFYDEAVKGNITITITFSHSQTPILTREFQIDGNIKIAIDLKTDLQLKTTYEQVSSSTISSSTESSSAFLKYYIEAVVTDASNEEQSWATKEIEIYSQPYKIEIQSAKEFDPSAIINIKVKALIKDLEGNLIRDTNTPIEIKVGCTRINQSIVDTFQFEYQKSIGEDFAEIMITNKNYTVLYLYAEYQRSKSPTEFINKRLSAFHMEILTESPEEGKELQVKISNGQDPFEDFAYEIVSKGDIIQSGHVNVNIHGNETSYILRLNMTFAMVPKITIYIHSIRNMSFIGELKDVGIKRAFQNSIVIKTDKETNPGKPVYINVTTNEGSYVGLMGLDRSVLENVDKNEILNEENVNTKLARFNSLKFYHESPGYGRSHAGVITFSNAFPPGGEGHGGGGFAGGIPLPLRLRKLFPESWLFIDFEVTQDGNFRFMETTPDTITTWAITGFSIHPDTGLTFTKNTTDLKVFQQFFVSFDLPSLVKEGEIIEVLIYINNYMNQDTLTNVTVETDSEDLEVLDHPEATTQSKENISKLISSKKRDKILLFIKPLKKGKYNVTVKAISSLASDAVQKTLNVEPQGVPQAMSKTYLVHLPEEGVQEDEITIDILKNAVFRSQSVEVSVVGDIFRPLMRYLEKRARVPYGNGEENMRFIVTNCLVLEYLQTLNYSNPSLENKIIFNLRLGYQNQLPFKYLDGSFGLFDRKVNKQRTGDIWQTAFALWGLKQANEFIPIDFNTIKRGFQYLESKQLENGCFGSSNNTKENIKLTAFAVMVFLTDLHSRDAHSDVITKGLQYLSALSDDVEYSAIYVMSKYALLLGNHEKAFVFFENLVAKGGLKSKQMLWTKTDTLQSHLETTVASLISLFESHNKTEKYLLHIVRGLIVTKEKEDSSVNRMIALQVLVSFVETLLLGNKNLSITFSDDQNHSGVFQVNVESSQVLQTFKLSENSRKINLQSKGQGFAVVNVKYKYNIVPENQSSLFFTVDISTRKTSKYLRILKICSSLIKNDNQNKLTIMEVDLQSGYIFNEKDSAEDEDLSENIKSIKVNDSREKVRVYFKFLAGNEVCIELEVRKTYKVFNSKPGWVLVYGAHDKDRKTAKSFRINESL